MRAITFEEGRGVLKHHRDGHGAGHGRSVIEIELIRAWWDERGDDLVDARRKYEWPEGTTTEESLRRRAEVAGAVFAEAASEGHLSRPTLERVFKWGFNNDVSALDRLSDIEIVASTRDAIRLLEADRLVEAALAAMRPRGIGISRASKYLAFVDESRFGIYDSRVGRALATLAVERRVVMPIPPDRSGGGTTSDSGRLAQGFSDCTLVLREVAALAAREGVDDVLSRPADVEMGLFMLGGCQ